MEEGYKTLLKYYGNIFPKPFVITCDDWTAACIDKHYSEVISRFYCFGGRCEGIISHYIEKDNIKKLGIVCGCNVPKSEIVQKGALPTILQYPVITKTTSSMSGAWKQDVHICHTKEELLRAYSAIKADKLLLQEYIEKKCELNIAGFSINNGNDVFLPFEMTSVRAPEGTYGHFIGIRPLEDDNLRQSIAKIIKETSYNGVFSVDLLIGKNGLKYLLEVNFRHSAFSYSCNYGGCNLLKEWSYATLERRIEYNYLYSNLLRIPYRAMAEPKDFYQSVINNRVSLWRWLKDFYNAEVKFYYAAGDGLPAIKEWCALILGKLRIILWLA